MSLKYSPSFLHNFSESEMIGESPQSYRFGSFRLNVVERQLLRNETPIPLTPKAFEVLKVLVARSGHLVEKEELLEKVWPGSYVEEANIARMIHTLRKVLGEQENGEKFIETVAKSGYRFVAGVTEERDPAVRESINSDRMADADFPDTIEIDEPIKTSGLVSLAQESHDSKRQMRVVLFTVGFLTAVSLIFLLSFNFRSAFSSSTDGARSFAVLPLRPINSANRDEGYEIGIAESLIHKIGSMKGFVVRHLSATRQYADINQDPLIAGREQKVDYVLASSYQLANGKIQVTAQLFNVANGQVEETYKSSEKDAAVLFAMQDEIANEVGNLLRLRFATSPDTQAKRGTASEEAYRLYLLGSFGRGGATESIKAFEQAIQIDPGYARAWAGLAQAYRDIGNSGRKTNRHEQYQKSIDAANKALSLDPILADAHSALCENKMFYEYDFAGAERECKRAIDLEPNSSKSRQTYARFLSGRGRHDEAIAESIAAIDLDPASFNAQHAYGITLHFARRYAEAATQFKRLIAMDEDFGLAYMTLVVDLALSGNEAEAFEWWKKLMVIWKSDEETVRSYTEAFQESGWQGVTRERAKRFENGNEVYFHGASWHSQIDKDKAFEYLERSLTEREIWISYLEVDPRLDALRDDLRYLELVSRVKSASKP